MPSTSGEIMALNAADGLPTWSESLAASDPETRCANLDDIAGRPVIDGMAGLRHCPCRQARGDFKLGEWRAKCGAEEISGTQTPWVAGDYVFVITNGQVMPRSPSAMARCAGRSSCPADLGRAGPWRRPAPGGELRGQLCQISPQTGRDLTTINLGERLFIPPVIASGTVYLLVRRSDVDRVALSAPMTAWW